MAKNIRQGELGKGIFRLGVIATSPASPVSGDPVRWGSLVGVAEVDMDPVTSITNINTNCIAELNVQGVDQSGNSAVAASDKIYYTDGDTVKLSKKNTGFLFGIAYGNALTDGGPDTRSGTLVASANAGTKIRVLVGKANV